MNPLMKGLLGGIDEYMNRPDQNAMPSSIGQPMQQHSGQLGQSAMHGQMMSAQHGLPQSGFGGQMSMAAQPGQSPINPVKQPGLLDLIGDHIGSEFGKQADQGGLRGMAMKAMMGMF